MYCASTKTNSLSLRKKNKNQLLLRLENPLLEKMDKQKKLTIYNKTQNSNKLHQIRAQSGFPRRKVISTKTVKLTKTSEVKSLIVKWILEKCIPGPQISHVGIWKRGKSGKSTGQDGSRRYG